MIVLLITLLIAGRPSHAEDAYETVGRRFTFLPLSGFSSDDGLGGGFRLAQFDYDGSSVPYVQALSLQAFVTTKGKWAHLISADFPHISPNSRLQMSLRYNKEETANFFGDLTDADLAGYTSDEKTFQQIDVYFTLRWIRDLRKPWRVQIRLRVGSTLIDPHTGRSVITTIAPLGFDGGHLAQFGGAIRYDTRDDYTISKSGRLQEVGIEWGVGGGADFNGGEISLEHRHFKMLNDQFVLAQRFCGTYTLGDVPFYERPKLGSSKTLRGLSADRFRDDVRLLSNHEIRWLGVRLSKRHLMYGGLNAFADVGQVLGRGKWPTSDWKVGLGLGIQLYWYSTIVRADYARAEGGSALYMRFHQNF